MIHSIGFFLQQAVTKRATNSRFRDDYHRRPIETLSTDGLHVMLSQLGKSCRNHGLKDNKLYVCDKFQVI